MAYPLWVVTGTSGSGKTTSALEVRKLMGVGFNVYDMDTIVIGQDYPSASENWLKIAYYNAINGHKTILFGAVPYPYILTDCKHYHHFHPIYYLLLHCDEKTRSERLLARGTWSQEGIEYSIVYAQKLVENAKSVYNRYPIIDTSTNSVALVANEIKKWVLSK